MEDVYKRQRWDKAKKVVQDLYCNHGGNSHPVYDFFQDSEIKYEDIISWKMEAKQYLEQKAIEKRAKETALRLLRAGMDPAATQASKMCIRDREITATTAAYCICVVT